MFDAKKNNNWEDCIRGRSVIFVGPSPIMVGRGMGEFIDSFDVVVRTGDSPVLVDKGNEKDYGSRTDILYVNNQFLRLKILPVELYRKIGLKWLCVKNLYIRNPAGVMVKDLGLRVRDCARAIAECGVSGPMMGVILIDDILKCGPERFYLCGIDFYTEENPYHDDYIKLVDVPEEIVSVMRLKGHSQKNNTEYIYKKYVEGGVDMPYFITERMKQVLA